MQELFEDDHFGPYTKMKTKMSADFTLMCHIVNKYCR